MGSDRWIGPGLHPDDEPGFAGPLWDADPNVCCAAFQTGACSHTEDYDWEEEE
jgi:hypothetical protein